ncbi:MAG: radical SAM superfamily enzyme YgiQ (UPF0313 family) [Bacteriovoracaceae bacterium]|jgi:radical SAM superfamily enzyme YgiQ (UPF0313 family)
MSDIVLINPSGRKKTYQELDSGFTAIEIPIWAGLITTYLRKKGHQVRLIDANALGLSPEETLELVLHEKPLLVAVIAYGHNPSASTQTMPATLELVEKVSLSSYAGKTIIVGGHAAALPKKTLTESFADYVCSGEGPYTLEKLLHFIKKDLPIKDVEGLCYKMKDKVIQTNPAPFVEDLDLDMNTIPWDDLPISNYRSHNWHAFGHKSRQPYISLYTTLGCPYSCSFCCIQAPFKEGELSVGLKPQSSSYRKWSSETILSQIDHVVKKYKVKHIKFADELFVLDKNHVSKICDGLIERGYDLNIWAYSRVDTITEDLAKKLSTAGVKWICLGIESFNEESLDDVNKNFTKSQLKDSIQMLKKNNINIIGNFIFGLPSDTISSMTETLKLAMELELDFANFYSAMAYPGSELYKEAIQKGYPLPDNWDGYSQHSFNCLPLPTDSLTGTEVLSFRDSAFHQFFENPIYLNYVEAKFGSSARAEIESFTKIKLKRKHSK